MLDLGLRGTRHLCELIRHQKLRLSASDARSIPEQTDRSRRERIAVAGAGLAGLATAHLLERRGFAVSVFEARGRPGGRIHTLRSRFTDGLFAEAGATRISDSHSHTMAWLRRFGLAVQPMYPYRGRLVREAPSGVERGRSCSGLSLSDLNHLVNGNRRWDSQFGGAVPATRRLIGQSLVKPGWFCVEEGADRLPRAIADALRCSVRYHAPLSSVAQAEDAVEVTWRERGGARRRSFDRLVMAIPATILRRIEFTPALSPTKRRAARVAEAHHAVRVFFQFRDRSWLPRGLNGFGRTHDGIEIWQPTFASRTKQPILVFYALGEAARDLVPLAPQERIARISTRVDEIFPGALARCRHVSQFCWDDEPWSRGAQSTLEYVDDLPLDELGAQEGRIHFAGEHTSEGWMDGTLQSAHRVADEIVRSVPSRDEFGFRPA